MTNNEDLGFPIEERRPAPALPPPPAPPLPTQKPSVLQRFIGPLAFSRPVQREIVADTSQSSSTSPTDTAGHGSHHWRALPKTASHKTGLSIAAIDINDARTHAVVAGQDLLQVIRVEDRSMREEHNVRGVAQRSMSSLKLEEINQRRDFLPAKDVRWAHGLFNNLVATAANGGRIALWDVSRGNSRVEKHRFYSHKNQVNKLDFDPHAGRLLLSGSQDKTVQIWDIKELDKNSGPSFQIQEQAIRAAVRDVRWCPTDIMYFALCTEDGTILKFDMRKHRSPVLSIPRAHEKKCYTIQWHPDGKHLASGGLDKNLKVWDISGSGRVKKSLLQLRCPANIMNVAWRPACWSEEFAGRGSWQSTQIATSYNKDDPRVHVWDLRRQFIPFREIAFSEHRPHDILWKDKDLLWSAGESGVLVQNDVSYAPHPEDLLPPCVVDAGVDNTVFTVLENRAKPRHRARTDPAALFLNIPPEKLSGAHDSLTSHSVTDDEGTEALDHQRNNQQANKSNSQAQSVLSSLGRFPVRPQANTLLNGEDKPTLSLDRAIQAGKEAFFVNGQRYTRSRIPGFSVPIDTIINLVEGLAVPSTAQERQAQPDKILDNLYAAFVKNSKICRDLGLNNFAAQWNHVGNIVVPELANWANYYRRRRYQKALDAEQSRAKIDVYREQNGVNVESAFSGYSPLQKTHGGSIHKIERHNPMLSRIVKDEHKPTQQESHYGSNVTTPRQLPVPHSPRDARPGTTWFTVPDSIEPIQPLPASLGSTGLTFTGQNSDQTNLITLADSSLSSSDSSRPTITQTRKQTKAIRSPSQDTPSKILAQEAPVENVKIPMSSKSQQDRRAALRDYKAPHKQPFSFEPSLASYANRERERHDSTDSYAFPASMSSSAKFKDFGQSFDLEAETPDEADGSLSRKNSDAWEPSEACYDSVGRSGPTQSGGSQGHFMPFGLDGASDPVLTEPNTGSASLQLIQDAFARPNTDAIKKESSISGRTQGAIKFSEQSQKSPPSLTTANMVTAAKQPPHSDKVSVPRPGSSYHARDRWHSIQQNPMLKNPAVKYNLVMVPASDPSLKWPFVIEDFPSIDITRYEAPHVPFVLSTYARTVVLIEEDINHAKLGGFFSANLLAHLLPFFWHPSLRQVPTLQNAAQSIQATAAQRLLDPGLATTVLRGIFERYVQFLEEHQLMSAARAFRNFAASEADFPELLTNQWAILADEGASVGDRLKTDAHALMATCSHCLIIMPLPDTVCKQCSQQRGPCAVCEQPLITGSGIVQQHSSDTRSSLVLCCSQCGHAGHESCWQQWFEVAEGGGICPVPGCFHDCVPGPAREARLDQNSKEKEQAAAVKGSISSTATRLQRDPLRAGSSPAVDKARDTLRKSSSVAGQATQSGDEQTPSSGGGSAWSRGTSFARRVRIQEPGEE